MPQLVPVADDYDPFNDRPVQHVPVEHDPFQSDPYTAAEPPAGFHDPHGPAITKAVVDLVGGPGRAMQANPYPPGSEEWEFYEQSRASGMSKWGAETAKQMAGAGTPSAARDVLGVIGRRILAIGGHRFVPVDHDPFAAK